MSKTADEFYMRRALGLAERAWGDTSPNPMVGAAGISAFPMSARVIQRLGQEADPGNHLLMHAVGANVAGQIGSVLAGGILLAYLG